MTHLSNYKTTWEERENGIYGSVTYTHTRIVQWADGDITLNSDGWETVTTKRKMNQASEQFCLGYRVFQKNYKWFVELPSGQVIDYVDNMKFARYPNMEEAVTDRWDRMRKQEGTV